MKRIIFTLSVMVGFIVFNPGFLGETKVFAGDSLVCPDYPAYSVLEAVYDCKVEEEIVYGRVKYKIRVWDGKSAGIPVLSEDIAINKADLPRNVLLSVDKGWYRLMFAKDGEYSITIDFISKVKRAENKNVFVLKPSGAVVSKLNLIIPGTNLDVEVEPSLSVEIKEAQNKNTQLLAFLGTTKELRVRWSSEPQTSAAIKPVFFSENNTLMVISPGIIRTTSILNYRIMQGKVSKLTINLPTAINLLAVKGKDIQSWDLNQKDGRQILEVELSEEISDEYELTLEMEEAKEETTGTHNLLRITTLGAGRQSGYIAIRVKGDLKLQSGQREGVSQIDVAQLPERIKRAAENDISFAYRYLKQPVSLSLNIEKIKPEIITRNNVFLHVDEDLMKLAVFIDYDIRKVGVFNLDLELPVDFTLIDVEGKGVEDWTLTKEGRHQLLGIRLKNKVLGKYQLLIKMEKPLKDVFAGLEVPAIKVRGVKKEIGYIGISSASNIKLITETRENLAEVDISELIIPPKAISVQPVLAYKYIEFPYKLKLSAQAVDSRVTTEVFTFMSVEEGLLLIDSAITYNILYAGVDEFTVAFPEDIQVVDISGRNIKSKEESIRERKFEGKKVKEKVWKIRLHSRIKGTYNLYCSYEKPVNETEGTIDLPKLRVLDVQRETGYWCLGSRANAEIKTNFVVGAAPIDIEELPKDKAGGIDVSLLLAFKYVRQPYSISIDVKRHQEVSVLVAMVESADITTLLTCEGRIIVNARYMIKNRQKQYLDISLPENANIWGAFVNNKPVKPSRTKEGKIVIPLEKSRYGNNAFPVEIIYEAKQSALKLFGRLNMVQPRLDIPAANITCRLYLPEEFSYTGFRGNIKIDKGKKIARVRHYPSGSINNYDAVKSVSGPNDRMTVGEEKEFSARQQEQQDKDFLFNLKSQVARYQKYAVKNKLNEGQALSKKGINQGKLVGALPIRVSIPTGGKLYTFRKLFSSNEEITIKAIYSKGLSAKLLFLAGIISGLIVSVKVVSKYRKDEVSLDKSQTEKNNDNQE